MLFRLRWLSAGLMLGVVLGGFAGGTNVAAAESPPLRFAVFVSPKCHPDPVTGRVLLFLCRTKDPEPWSFGFLGEPEPVYAIDVTNLPPGTAVAFTPEKFSTPESLAFPRPLDEWPAGTYYAQAVVRADRLGLPFRGPGNFQSRPRKCRVAPSRTGTITLVADREMPDRAPPMKDTEWVKAVRIRSKLLSDFHGREITLRAGVVLPSTFRDRPEGQFPVLYQIPSFGGSHLEAWESMDQDRGKRWQAGQCPLQLLRVVLDPEVPLGHSAFADSANNGPVAAALIQELIPEIERRFHGIPRSEARFVAGHSSGGWAALWLQANYPDVFGGCWSTSPDPVDFSVFQTMNIYEDTNGHWNREGYPRPLARDGEQVVMTFLRLGRWEYVVGDGFQLGSFNAVFGPRGPDGRPKPLIQPVTGRIDPEVAQHWKRYDIRRLLENNWPTIGPRLKGKLHIVAGASDSFYLEGAVLRLKEFLEKTDFGGYVRILPGGHNSFMTDELLARFDAEIAEKFHAYNQDKAQ